MSNILINTINDHLDFCNQCQIAWDFKYIIGFFIVMNGVNLIDDPCIESIWINFKRMELEKRLRNICKRAQKNAKKHQKNSNLTALKPFDGFWI